MNEADTRAEYIDPTLRKAGWGLVEGSRILREYPITLGRLESHGRRGSILKADYVLVFRNTCLAVIEAKAWDKALTEGVGQAKDYAEKMHIRFAYATNGQGIYSIDMHTGEERELDNYPSPDELWNFTFSGSNNWRDRFAEIPFEDGGGRFQSRYYQDIAINRVLKSIAAGSDRILLTLATGTGKTFIAFQIAWKLFHSRWNLQDWRNGAEPSRLPRILFLADRNILANQAFNDFSPFPEDALIRIEPKDIRKKGKVPKNGSLFFTIFQTFMSGTTETGEPSPYFGEYPKDFFDFIIIDECHRGGARDESTWRSILEYFSPAVQLGLTATPKREINADTYSYFGEPVYVYSLKEGINDGFLTPFKVREIQTTLDNYEYEEDDDLIEGEIDEYRTYTESDFNRIIEIKERERHRVRLFMDMIDQREKTIVFCATQEHALIVRDLINQTKSSTNPNYCVRVTADEGKIGDQHLLDFKDNEKTIPTILTTSQKLSTGVDARNIRNIILMRPINSMIEFKQIIGRGTRLYDGKYYFTIYDFVQAHLHFRDPEWDGEPLEPEPANPRPNIVADPPGGYTTDSPPARPRKIKIKLADGKERSIQNIVSSSFWSADGRPMSAAEFLQSLFGTLPEFFENEEELRTIWSNPNTRSKFLETLASKGFGKDVMDEMRRIIDAERSDLYDVLAYVAFALDPIKREDRASTARNHIQGRYNDKQQAFIDFVLSQYESQGVEELSPQKLSPLLKLLYNNAIVDAINDLGNPEQIRGVFVDFQQFLYR